MSDHFEPKMTYRREFSFLTYLPDGNVMYVSDEPAGYERFIEAYAHHGDLNVEVRPFQFGKDIGEPVGTTKLSELIEPVDLVAVEGLKSLRKELPEIDKHILSNLGEDWVPPTTYKQLESEKFKRSELGKAMAKLRKLDLVKYCPGWGNCLSRRGVLIQLGMCSEPDHEHVSDV